MNSEESFDILSSVYKGNFLQMPFKENLEHRECMKQAIRERIEMAAALRNLCKLDLFFLCHGVLGFTDTVERVHRPYAPQDFARIMQRAWQINAQTFSLKFFTRLVLLFNLPFALGALMYAYENLFGPRTARTT